MKRTSNTRSAFLTFVAHSSLGIASMGAITTSARRVIRNVSGFRCVLSYIQTSRSDIRDVSNSAATVIFSISPSGQSLELIRHRSSIFLMIQAMYVVPEIMQYDSSEFNPSPSLLSTIGTYYARSALYRSGRFNF